MASFDPPTSGTPLKMGSDGTLDVADDPVIPFIEGDGIGPTSGAPRSACSTRRSKKA